MTGYTVFIGLVAFIGAITILVILAHFTVSGRGK